MVTVTSTHPQMENLCASFPCLRGRMGTLPWNQHDFAAGIPGMSSAEKQAATFVLSVWNGGNHHPWWKRQSKVLFDAVYAMQLWDEQNQAAFLAWCENPFYP